MTSDAVVGLVPAAGHARRLALASGSKELLEVPDLTRTGDRSSIGQVPVCRYLLDQYRTADIREVTVVRRAEKLDLAEYLESTACEDLAIEQLVVSPTPGSAHSLALGCERHSNRTIAIGFPDIVMTPNTLCREALAQLDRTGADVCLAHVPIPDEERDVWDKTELDGERVVGLVVKPAHLAYDRSWVMAVWRPVFSAYLIDWLVDDDKAGRVCGEIALSHPIQGAIAAGLHVTASFTPGGFALDVGKPDRLRAARALGRGL